MALVHDYLTQRGGAERVVVAMLRAFPGAPLFTSLYQPQETFPEFASADVRVMALNRVGFLRSDHRRALPLLAPAFARLRIDAEVVLCSSSGWAHGVSTKGRKIVYCHNPPRWLYQTSQYLGRGQAAKRLAVEGLRRWLTKRDKAAASTASLYIANSSIVRRRIQETYGRDAEVLHPPPALTPGGQSEAIDEIEPGFFLCVSRLLPYKNVDAVAEAFRALPEERLVVVGSGPAYDQLTARAPGNVRFLGRAADEQLRWLYANCQALVAASYEDFGLTPLEAAGFGRPSVVLRWGGFLDTVVEDETGLFFNEPAPADIAEAIRRATRHAWDLALVQEHASRFSEARFAARLREIVRE